MFGVVIAACSAIAQDPQPAPPQGGDWLAARRAEFVEYRFER